MNATPTIMVRARITEAEWIALRKLALDLNTAPADLIGNAIRTVYPTLTNGDTTDDR